MKNKLISMECFKYFFFNLFLVNEKFLYSYFDNELLCLYDLV